MTYSCPSIVFDGVFKNATKHLSLQKNKNKNKNISHHILSSVGTMDKKTQHKPNFKLNQLKLKKKKQNSTKITIN